MPNDITPNDGILNTAYENALLGFILVDPDKMLEVSEILPTPDYFTQSQNRTAWEIFLKLFREDRFPGSPALMISELHMGAKAQFPTEMEAAGYVNRLLNAPTTEAKKFNPKSFVEYAEYIKWERDKKKLTTIADEIKAAASTTNVADKEEFVSSIEDQLAEVTMNVHGKDSLLHISEITEPLESQLARLRRGEKLGGGVMTGIDMLDKTLNGLKGGEMCVLAARPAQGKTTLSMQIAYNVAKTLTDGKPNAVLIFSLEMMEDQLMSRMVATSGRINMKSFMEEYEHLIDDGYYARAYSKSFEDKMRQKLDIQFQRAEIALDHVKKLPIYTTTEPGMTPNSIKSLVMQKKREIEKNGEHLALVVIDYLQLMVPSLMKANASRTEEVGDMSRKMKLLAKEFDVPVLLLAQLNRNADVTERPNLKDLRESGSIEQDADKVMFIWSEHADKSPSDFSEYREDAARVEALRREQQKVTISVAKNRQGESGDVPVIFDKGFQTFVSQSDEYAANNEQYEEFAAKYYQKTRTDDLFWPLRTGEIPEEMERFRNPLIRECPYLTPDGKLITMANEGEGGRGSMTIQSTPITPATQNTSPQSPQDAMYDESSYGQLDRTTPAPLPEIDDLSTGFEEIGDEDDTPAIPAVITADNIDQVPFDDDDDRDGDVPAGAASSTEPGDEEGSASDIEMDDDDMDIDLDSLDLLDALTGELES